ncbi:MAG: iron-containing alcohol dehydrogenase [Lachnospiraceae bacterium]|nr:iron-containing alcohol dehydrogenase [Lachnospiraceae bacterium]
MIFNMPVKVYQEKDAVLNRREEISALGSKAMIVTGKNSSKKNGSLSDLTDALDKTGVSYVIFDDIEENPSVETVMKAREIGVNEGVDFCIGLGGGSPLDAAKAIALMIKNKDKGWEYMYDKSQGTSFIPVACIPTTCGTGSEVTGVSVITRKELETKMSLPHRIFPSLALVDGKYLYSCPRSVIANTAMDALAHMYESYINKASTPYSEMFVNQGITLWSKEKDILTGVREGEPCDYDNLLTASTLAGMAIAHTGTSLPHGLSYNITIALNVRHGVAVSLFQAGFMEQAPKEMREHLLKLSGFKNTDEFISFFNEVCAPPEIPKEYKEAAALAMFQKKEKLMQVPYEVTEETLRKIVFR